MVKDTCIAMLAAATLILTSVGCSRTSQLTAKPGARSTMTPSPKRSEARVVEVVSGDTIEVAVDGRTYLVRYLGIDAPAAGSADSSERSTGAKARAANERLVEGKTVYLERGISEVDENGQRLRYVFLGDGSLVNAEIVRLGYARVTAYSSNVRYRSLLLEMQQEAREVRRGLWKAMPTPEWRPGGG